MLIPEPNACLYAKTAIRRVIAPWLPLCSTKSAFKLNVWIISHDPNEELTDWIYPSLPIQKHNSQFECTNRYYNRRWTVSLKQSNSWSLQEHWEFQMQSAHVGSNLKNFRVIWHKEFDWYWLFLWVAKFLRKFYYRNIQIIISILLVVNHWSINGPSSPKT